MQSFAGLESSAAASTSAMTARTTTVLALVLALLVLAEPTALLTTVQDAARAVEASSLPHAVLSQALVMTAAAAGAVGLRVELVVGERNAQRQRQLRDVAVLYRSHAVARVRAGEMSAAAAQHRKALSPGRSAAPATASRTSGVAATVAAASAAVDTMPGHFLINPIYARLVWPHMPEQQQGTSSNTSSSGGSGGGRTRRRGVPTAAEDDLYCQFLLYRTRKAPPKFCRWLPPACTFPVLVTGLATADLHETAVLLVTAAAVEVTDRGNIPVRCCVPGRSVGRLFLAVVLPRRPLRGRLTIRTLPS